MTSDYHLLWVAALCYVVSVVLTARRLRAGIDSPPLHRCNYSTMLLGFLLHTLRRLSTPRWRRVDSRPQPPDGAPDARAPEPGPLETLPEADENDFAQARSIFRIWVVIYGLVGAQMGWLLRPFVGDPGMPFTWFRARGGNFFAAVWNVLQSLVEPLFQ